MQPAPEFTVSKIISQFADIHICRIIYREEMRSADDMFCDKSDKHFKYHAKGNLNATIFPKEIEEIDVYCAEKCSNNFIFLN